MVLFCLTAGGVLTIEAQLFFSKDMPAAGASPACRLFQVQDSDLWHGVVN